MLKRFCDKCDQQLIEPDEKIDFVTGKPSEGDLCWQCRLQEVVNLYNGKTQAVESRALAVLHWSPPMKIRSTQIPAGTSVVTNYSSAPEDLDVVP